MTLHANHGVTRYEFTRCSARREPAGNASDYTVGAMIVVAFVLGILVMVVQ